MPTAKSQLQDEYSIVNTAWCLIKKYADYPNSMTPDPEATEAVISDIQALYDMGASDAQQELARHFATGLFRYFAKK